MATNHPDKTFYQFGPFCLDAGRRLMLKGREVVSLAPKAIDMLLLLVRHRGEVLDKESLMKGLWPDTTVEENNLTVIVSALRKALGETPTEHRYIVTISGRGYSFVAEVSETMEETTIQPVNGKIHSLTGERENISTLPSLNDGEPAIPPPSSPTMKFRRPWRRALIGGLALLGLSGLIATSAYFLVVNKSDAPLSRPGVKSIAVLPFKSLGGEEKDSDLGLGMADALITKLGKVRQIVVRPTNAVIHYAGRYTVPSRDLQAVGRELGVEAVLDGRMQRADDRVRVTVQLIRTSDGAPLWSEKFDEQFTNLFGVQDAISEAIARALTLTLTGDERRQVAKRYTDNPEAYQLYLRGRHFWNQRTADGYRRAIECFEQATKIDSNYALALAGLADAYQLLGGSEGATPPKEVYPKARAAAARALEIDPTLAEAHTSLARVSVTFDRDWPSAERGFKRAIELNPNYTLAHVWYANYLAAAGRFEEAFVEISLAQRLDPLSALVGANAGRVFFAARQYDRAIEEIRKALELDRNFWPGHWYLGWAYEAKGMYREALSEFEKTAAITGDRAEMAAELARVYALSGRKDEARKALENLIKRSQAAYVSPCALALIHVGLGERDEAFAWLQKGYEDRCWQMNFLKIDPRFDSLRTDPRFAELLQRNNLMP